MVEKIKNSMRVLIIGNGYLGNRCFESWPEAIMAETKINKEEDVLELLERHKPDAVLNAAGVVGKPNVDWCETHQMVSVWGNTILPVVIAKACQKRNTYLLHMGTGCIFYGASPDSKGWKESDFGNPSAVYTRAKYSADLVLSTMLNIGIARIRMPIDYKKHPANLIDKLISFKKVVDVENSLTVVEDMINVFSQLLEKKAFGIFHVTNSGSIRHKEIIEIYKELIDGNHQCEWINEQDLVDFGLAAKKRSNNIMQSENLKKIGIKMRPAKEAVRETIKKYH
jgi:dTDP-4-dehydrorhamnose reductase